GTASVTGAAISLRDSSALTAALTASGNSTLQAAGDLVVRGSTVNLTTSTTSAGTTHFGATTISGNLDVTSAGAVSQTGALAITGTSAVVATGSNVTLADSPNNFSGSTA
ncbi:hypothetical protein ACVBEH_28100, partial [Roseateles sp. GG27B]